MSTLFCVSVCLHVWDTNSMFCLCLPAYMSCTRSACAGHARTLINVNPFFVSACLPAFLHHASGPYLPFTLNHMRLCCTDLDVFESVVVCKTKIDVFSSYCIRQFLTIQFLLKITYIMFVWIIVNYLINNSSYINSINSIFINYA